MPTSDHVRTPAQSYAAIAGGFLLALGVLGLISGDSQFATVDRTTPADFLIWNTTGWTTIMWIVAGLAGLAVMARSAPARAYALTAGLFFAVIAVWGFIDGQDVFTLIMANTVNNITHAVLGVLGLAAGLLPRTVRSADRPAASPPMRGTSQPHA